MYETSCLMPSHSLGPRPKTMQPQRGSLSVSHGLYWKRYMHQMRSEDENSPVGQNHGITSGEQEKAFAK